MTLLKRFLLSAFLGVIAVSAPCAHAEDSKGSFFLQGAASVFDAGAISGQGTALTARSAALTGSASSSSQNGLLRGQTGVFDSGTLQGGIRTASLNSGLSHGKFSPGDARMAPTTGLYAGKASSGRLTGGTKRLMFKAFAKMTCVEFNELQANSYSVEYNYQPVSLDQTLALPGFHGNSVQCFTDGKHLVAIDPRSLETWVADPRADVTRRSSWRKLLHVK